MKTRIRNIIPILINMVSIVFFGFLVYHHYENRKLIGITGLILAGSMVAITSFLGRTKT